MRFSLEKNTAFDIVVDMKLQVPGKSIPALFIIVVICLWLPYAVSSEPSASKMILTQAVMCESIENFKPVNPAVVFSISQGEVFCFSNFDPVFEKTYIFHKWYKKDKLIFTMRLTLSPPKWSSFSSMQIRNADKGPWRVEIRDVDDTLLKTLRFSMAD
ncbi:DUF2914 domain-containing protein [Desulfobacula sp.]|uniref:DUF2914 domain-containing protein n=1 Tax=Desulfobacula sp. TaxID=2593537 RepID=UPI002631CB0A|nr:DUF2914 domain-containing protein [Desulfobacula sp.]